MNRKERVLATMQRQPADRTPIDCWLYQRQFVEKLAAEYGTPEKRFMDEFNIDIFAGFVPYPNQLGRRVDVTELVRRGSWEIRPYDPKWLTHSDWNYDFAGVSVTRSR